MIHYGPAGWQYKDWEAIVYPVPKPKGFDPLAYIAGYFSTIEINSTYYGSPRPATADKRGRLERGGDLRRDEQSLQGGVRHERGDAQGARREEAGGRATAPDESLPKRVARSRQGEVTGGRNHEGHGEVTGGRNHEGHGEHKEKFWGTARATTPSIARVS
jgi:hypothetical protein